MVELCYNVFSALGLILRHSAVYTQFAEMGADTA